MASKAAMRMSQTRRYVALCDVALVVNVNLNIISVKFLDVELQISIIIVFYMCMEILSLLNILMPLYHIFNHIIFSCIFSFL